MIVDTSALIAILRGEPEAERFARVIALAGSPAMSAASYLEASIVIDRPESTMAQRLLDDLIDTLRIEIVPFTRVHAQIARQAYRQFGKGSGHAAQLNFGDCISYALAADRLAPLLFKGADFAETDLPPAC